MTRPSLLLLLLLLAGIREAAGQAPGEPLTLEAIFGSTRFAIPSLAEPRWIGQGPSFSYLQPDSGGGAILRYALDDTTASAVLRPAWLVDPLRPAPLHAGVPFPLGTYEWSSDGTRILVAGRLPGRPHANGGNFGVFDPATRAFRLLTDTGEPQADIRFSPDGSLAGFVRANNLFVLDVATGRERQLTFDGTATVLNGLLDRAYAEQFSIPRGWEWSPDGRHVAFWRLDLSRVPPFPLVTFPPDSVHGVLRMARYAKAGDPVPAARIGVIDLRSGATRWMETALPADHYLPRIRWTGRPGQLGILRLNRAQDTLQLLLADAATGRTRVVLTEDSPAFVDVESADLHFLARADAFLWTSSRDGFRHLYRCPLEGGEARRLTGGEWDVTRLAFVDERRGLAFVVGTERSPRERHIYTVRLAGGGMRRISRERGWHDPDFAPGGLVYRDTWSSAAAPPVASLHTNDGARVARLVEPPANLFAGIRLGEQRFLALRMPDGSLRDASMILPPGFDSTRRYPVLFYVYGAPGSQLVVDAWGGTRALWHQMLAGEGYVVVSVDHRGTGFRGAAFARATHRMLGRLETEDLLAAARAVGRLGFCDSTRIGVWGWSAGGTLALLAMTGGDSVFRAGIAVAPVTDFRTYDAVWAERHLGLPSENPAGYAAASPVTRAGALRGELLLVHGTADDNVHWQNTALFLDALVRADRQVTTMVYPDRAHGLEGAALHLHTAMTRFLRERL